VSHDQILSKLVEHDTSIFDITQSIDVLGDKLDPIAHGIASMAFAFKVLLWLGAGSAAVVGIIELVNHA